MDRIFRGILKYIKTDREKMVEQFVCVRNNPEVSTPIHFNEPMYYFTFISYLGKFLITPVDFVDTVTNTSSFFHSILMKVEIYHRGYKNRMLSVFLLKKLMDE